MPGAASPAHSRGRAVSSGAGDTWCCRCDHSLQMPLRSTPMRSTSISTTSPAFIQTGGCGARPRHRACR
jgi:hypothetical protein